MMRSPYRSPEEPAPRYLRVQPRERRKRRRLLLAGALLVGCYLVYSFVGTESGLLRIQALRQENESLRDRKVDLAVRANDAEQARKAAARDPLLEERVARERFHLVKKNEVVYLYRDEPQAPDAGAQPSRP
jgi:cell division protein FtsB